MKHSLLLIAVFCCCSTALAAEDPLFARYIGKAATATGVIQSPDGSLYVSGYQWTDNSGDMWIVKVNERGKILWRKALGGPYSDAAVAVARADDGGVVVCGATVSFGVYNPISYVNDIVLVRLDGRGKVLWKYTYGEIGDDRPVSCIRTSDGNYLVLAESNSFDLVTSSNRDILLVKVDRNGRLLWSRQMGTRGDDLPIDIAQLGDQTFLLACFNKLILLDWYGRVLWAHDSSNIYFNQIVSTSDGGAAVLGEIILSTNPNTGTTALLRFSSGGDLLWSRLLGSPDQNSFSAIGAAPDGGIVVAGASGLRSEYDTDVRTAKIDRHGKMVWRRVLGAAKSERIHDVAVLEGGGSVVLAGSTGVETTSEYYDTALLWKTGGSHGRPVPCLERPLQPLPVVAGAGWLVSPGELTVARSVDVQSLPVPVNLYVPVLNARKSCD